MTPAEIENNPHEAINHVLRNTSATLEGICREHRGTIIDDAIQKMSWAISMLRRIDKRIKHEPNRSFQF